MLKKQIPFILVGVVDVVLLYFNIKFVSRQSEFAILDALTSVDAFFYRKKFFMEAAKPMKKLFTILLLLCIIFSISLSACSEIETETPPTYNLESSEAEFQNEAVGFVNSDRNVALSKSEVGESENKIFDSSYIEGNCYYYIYYLGEINKVALQSNAEVEYFQNLGQSQEIVFTTGESSSSSITNSISDAVEQCVSYKTSAGETVGIKEDLTISAEANILDIVNVKEELGIETSYQFSYTNEVGTENKKTSESSYEKALTTTTTKQKTVTIKLSEKCKNGYYRYTSLGNFQVFGVVIYDTISKEFVCYAESLLESWYWTLDYSETPTFSDDNDKKIVFNLPELDINVLGIPTNVVEKEPSDIVVEPAKIKLTLDPNGGTCETTEITGVASTPIELPVPKKPNCVFSGWIDTRTNAVANYTKMPSWDRTLKAKWVQTSFYFSKSEESAKHFGGGTVEFSLYEANNCNFNYTDLVNLGYTKFDVKIQFEMKDTQGCDETVKFSIGNLYLECKKDMAHGQNFHSIEVNFNDNNIVYLNTNTINLTLRGYRNAPLPKTWLAGQHINIVITAKK